MAEDDTAGMAAGFTIDCTDPQVAKPGPWPRLTRAERPVAEMLALGASCRQIADALGRNQKTINTHRGSILGKYSLSGQPALVRLALREGWVAKAESAYERRDWT